ncbi:MAG: hypothetical protein ACE14V_15895 [bacterium]
MKKVLIALALVALAITPSFAAKTFTFATASDTVGWTPAWNNGNVYGECTITWSATGGRANSGCMKVTIYKTIAGSGAVNVTFYPSASELITGVDTIYSVWIKANSAIQPPWYWVQAFAFTTGWGWTATGINGAATWTQYVNSQFGAGPTPGIGFQLPIDDNVAIGSSFEWVIDSIRVGSDSIPVELIDFSATPTKK